MKKMSLWCHALLNPLLAPLSLTRTQAARSQQLMYCVGGGPTIEAAKVGLSIHVLCRSSTARGLREAEKLVEALLVEGESASRGSNDGLHFTQVFVSTSPPQCGHGGMMGAPQQPPSWAAFCREPARLIDSVVLLAGEAERVLADARWFLTHERWYAQRGINYRRAFLFSGPPGTGKTSLVSAVAGELKLPIYVLRLGCAGISDEALHTLLNTTQPRSAIVIEDVDAAFAPIGSAPGSDHGSGGGLTFFGLLNALDGVATPRSRLLFLTTNHVAALPPALIRPGRVDVHVAFKLARAHFLHCFHSRVSHAACGCRPRGSRRRGFSCASSAKIRPPRFHTRSTCAAGRTSLPTRCRVAPLWRACKLR